MLRSVDVAVVGGGPGGIGAAARLAERGARVLVIERTCYDRPRIGETFPPAIVTSLSRVGLSDGLLATARLPSYGMRVIWGAPEPFERSFLFDPHGNGWHVDRQAFDAGLAREAERRGVEIARGAKLRRCSRSESGWQIRVGTGEIHARFVVDATGRAAALARRLGGVRQVCDRLIGIFGFLRTVRPPDECTLIEAVEAGWWYSSPLPGGRLVAAFMTDADLWPATALRDGSVWASQVRLAPFTQERVSEAALTGPARVIAASSSRLDPACGGGWLAAGDAAMTLDPVSGDGVVRALETGARAAEVILGCWAGDLEGLERYDSELKAQFASYLERRRAYYSRETRFAGSPFWTRRCA